MKLDLAFDSTTDPACVIITVECRDAALEGHDARLTVQATANVRRSGGVDVTNKVLDHKFVVTRDPLRLRVARQSLPTYTYQGDDLEISLDAKLKVDDGVLFDTTHREDVALPLPRQAAAAGDAARELLEPRDRYRFWANWRALPPARRASALALAGVLSLLAALNLGVATHDEFAEEADVLVYSRRDSKGKRNSPLGGGLALSGGIGAGAWYSLRRQLRSYMTISPGVAPRIDRTTPARVGELFHATSRVPLDNLVLRIVAGNFEQGQVRRRKKRGYSTTSFSRPARAVVLFEKGVAHVAANEPVEAAFDDAFSFAPLFDALYPPNALSSTTGVELKWEIQLLHDQYVDQELAGELSGLQLDDFFPRSGEPSHLTAPLPASML